MQKLQRQQRALTLSHPALTACDPQISMQLFPDSLHQSVFKSSGIPLGLTSQQGSSCAVTAREKTITATATVKDMKETMTKV